MSGPESVETPERVTLELDLAGVGSRALAQLVDLTIVVLAWLLFTVPLLILADDFGMWSTVLWFAFTFALFWFYHAAFEALWLGQTPGKRLLDLRVQKLGGYPIGWPEALLRNLLRPVDALFFYGVGVVTMMLTARHQRVGDLVAGTVVVREGQVSSDELERLGYGRRAPERPAVAPWLGTREYELLHDYVARHDQIDPIAARRIETSLARRLRDDLARHGHLNAEWAALDDREFLVQLHAACRGLPLAASVERS